MSLAGQRAQFTWALNQYNLAETTEQKTHFAKRMALRIQRAAALGFTKEQVVNGQVYPPEVDHYLNAAIEDAEPDISEEQAQREVEAAVDTSDMLVEGEGSFARMPLLLRRTPHYAKVDLEKEAMRYTVVLEQEADGGYSVSVPALPGCHSQGDTRAEALTNIREAIELYVETLRDAGEIVPTDAGKEFVEIEAA